MPFLLAAAGVACLVAAPRVRSVRGIAGEALALLGFLALAVAYTGLWSDFATRIRAGNDPVQDAWVLHMVTSNLIQQPSRLFDGNVFYPSYTSVLYADPLLGPVSLVLPLRAVTDNPAILYNAAMVLVLTLSSYGLYRLGLHLTGEAAASLLTGLLMPYSAQQMHNLQLSHLPYLSVAGFPILLLGLLKLLESPGPGPALLTGIAFAWQAGTDGYYAICSAILSLLVAAWGWRRLGDARVIRWCGVAATVGVLLILPYIQGFRALKEEAEMSRGLDWSRSYSTDLGTSLLRSPALLYGGLLDGPSPSKGGPLFPGLLPLLLAGIGVRRGERARVRLLVIVIGVFFLLSLGPELRFFGRSLLPLPFKVLFERVPFFDAMRHPITLSVPATLALSLLAVIGLHAVGWARRPLGLALVLVAAIAETLPATPTRVDHGTRLPEAYVFLLNTQPPGAILELPFEGNYGYEWWSIQHRLPIVNGELGFEPRWYAQLFHLIGREWSRRPPHQDMEDWASIRFLKGQVPLRYLILHRGTSGYIAENVEATSRTFELIHETADGDRIFQVHRGGVGPELRRRFRDDQLEARKIVTRLAGPQGAVVVATLNELPLGERTLASTPQGFGWSLPKSAIERGMNVFALKAKDGETRFELSEIEAISGR